MKRRYARATKRQRSTGKLRWRHRKGLWTTHCGKAAWLSVKAVVRDHFFDPQTSVGGSEDCERDLTSHLHESDFDLSDGEGMEDEEDRQRCEPLFDGVCPLSKPHWCSKQHAKTA